MWWRDKHERKYEAEAVALPPPPPHLLVLTLPNYAFPCFYGSLEVRQVLLILFSIGLAFSWVVIRHNSKSWLLQDLLGVIFSIYMIKTLRLPNLMVICVLLVLLFFYDIFFVFVTPYLVPKSMPHNQTGSFAQSSGKGDSIMVEVARGKGTDEHIPMVLRVPHLSNEDISACFGEYSVLGFGDILIPGFLVAYVRSFDLIATQGCLYYATSVTAYGVGLVVTFVGLYIMKMAQPALLYLVPATLIPVILVAWYRGELREIWYGYKPEASLPSEEELELPTMSGKRRNSSDEEERRASSRPSTLAIETPAET
ncbi:signal peptide peptidase-like 2B [Rhipicephalus microplus]|uniref:signal peptide peptidase-like 2B n=1 Tax=Rhipicephalus microplus TaxID=6941 RepID=UPI003F6C8EF7